MKKLYFYLLFTAFVIVTNAQPFTSLWQKRADGVDFAWFTADNNTVSLDYNPVTNRLLVSKRNTNIYIINPATGASEGTLSVTGLGTEAFKFNKIRVTSDGVIYGISLVTTASAATPGQCKIYRWADQMANPTLCADFAVTERIGDAFGLSGSGNNTILYAGGAALAAGGGNSINIYMLNTVNGLNYFVESKINVATSGGVTQWANRAVEPITNSLTSDLWINSGGGPARRITVGSNSGGVRTGTLAFSITDGVGNGQASVGYGGTRHLTTPNGKYLIFAGGNNSNAGTRMKMLNVTDEMNVTTYGLDSLGDPLTDYVTNANGTGDAAYRLDADGGYTVFYLSTNNGFEATKTGLAILPVTLSSFNATIRNKSVLVNWSTATEINNEGFVIEKSVNGRDFSKIGFVASKAIDGNSTAAISYQFEDGKLLDGKSYYRLRQVDKDGKAAVSETKTVQNAISGFTVKVLSNPVSENIVLSMKTNTIKQVQLALTNASGAVLMSRNQQIAVGDNNVNIPVQQYATGLLFLSVKDGDTNQVIKIVKQ
jgi:hypothetical protein